MATYLLTWNPKKWNWATLDDDLTTYRKEGLWVASWSCGNRKTIFPEDRVFLIKQGPQIPRGIFASGYVTSAPVTARHFTDGRKQATYVDIDCDVLLDPRADVLPRERLDAPPFNAVHWATQSGGILIPAEVAAPLEELWDQHVRSCGLNPLGHEHTDCSGVVLHSEGTPRVALARRLERSAAARAACIVAKGVRCHCCEMDFGQRYGEVGKGFIHVHHQDPLASSGGRRATNPIEDLVPVCPNCHAMLHRKSPPLSVGELKARLRD